MRAHATTLSHISKLECIGRERDTEAQAGFWGTCCMQGRGLVAADLAGCERVDLQVGVALASDVHLFHLDRFDTLHLEDAPVTAGPDTQVDYKSAAVACTTRFSHAPLLSVISACWAGQLQLLHDNRSGQCALKLRIRQKLLPPWRFMPTHPDRQQPCHSGWPSFPATQC